MSSSDTLLNYVFQFMQTHNRLNDKKITPLQALNIYMEIIKAGK